MATDTQNTSANANNTFIPTWVKVVITFFALSMGVVLVLSAASAQNALFGFSTELILVFSSVLVLLFVAVSVALWYFPNSPLTVFIYWSICFLREQISVFALLGIVYLITIQMPLFSLRGGIPTINLVLLFLMGLFVPPVSRARIPFVWMKNILDAWQKLGNKINSLPALPFSVAVALLPILIILCVIYFGLDSRLSNYGPYSFWNDETGYWVWTRSFGHAPFHDGYHVPNEFTPQASFNHYGEGSPFYVLIYGTIARLMGWSSFTPILINFAILAVAIFLFIRLTRLEPVQILLVGLLTTLTWPILLYLPLTTSETLHQAIGFIFAIVFFKLLIDREELSLLAKISFVLLVYVATLIRLSWGLLLVPIVFYSLQGSILRRVFLAILLGAGLYGSAVLITNYLLSPVNNSILLNMRDSLVEGPQIFFKYISSQSSQMFKFKDLNPNIAVTFQIVVILGWSLMRLIRMTRPRASVDSVVQSRTVFDIYNVASLLSAGLLFYIQEGFYRTFTPSLLIVYLLQTVKKDYRFLLTLLAINIIFFQPYMTYYARAGDAAIIRANYTTEFSESAQLKSAVERWVVFDETTSNPWCNTLLIPLHYYDYRLMVIPPQIGISYILDLDTFQTPVKSKYLLFDPESYEALASRLNVKLLDSLPIGDLYYNQDSGCILEQ